MNPTDVLRTARRYVKADLSLVPVRADGSKRPIIPWKAFQSQKPTPAQIHGWYGGKEPRGIAIIAGAVSGGLEVIDFDTADLFDPWRRLVDEQAPGLIDKLVLVQSPRPGRHVYYRCSKAGGNTKLARRRDEVDPETGGPLIKTLIERKGERGLIIAPGSPKATHLSGRPYRFISDRKFEDLVTISDEEHELIIAAAKSLNEWSPPKRTYPPRAPRTPQPGKRLGMRPGDDFNLRGEWAKILEPHGWTFVSRDRSGVDHWRRPGKTSGPSATTGYYNGERGEMMFVFSENAYPFETGNPYTKFLAYTLLNHEGDFNEAARNLAEQGYGDKRTRERFRLNLMGRPSMFRLKRPPTRSRR